MHISSPQKGQSLSYSVAKGEMAGMGMGMSMSGGSGYKPQTTGGRRGGGDYYGNAASPLRGSKGASTMASSNF